MTALKELQSQFQEYLMLGNIEALLPSIAPHQYLSQEKRLKIYYDAYRIRLFEILKLDFPKTHTLMGDDSIKEAFITYLDKHPSTHFSVRYFGQHLSEFLKTTAPFSEQGVLAEMALFEWLIAYTIDAKDDTVLTIQNLSSLAPEKWADTAFDFHPSVMSHYFEWDTPQLWSHIENELPPRAPEQQTTPVRWVFWRKGVKSYFQSLNLAEDQMFKALQQGLNFSEICETLLDVLPEDDIAPTAAQTLFKWVNEEMISRIK